MSILKKQSVAETMYEAAQLIGFEAADVDFKSAHYAVKARYELLADVAIEACDNYEAFKLPDDDLSHKF